MAEPAGSSRGQDAPTETVGSWSLVLARPGLDPDFAHRLLVAGIDRGREGLARRLPQGRHGDPRNLGAAVPPEAVNPGTVRYRAEACALR